MVKLKKPLSSKSASGTLADKITYLHTRLSARAKFKQKKPVAKTSAQISLRNLFKEAAILAKDLTPEQKDYYAGLKPDSAACPWWNNFIGEYIKENWPVSADVNSYTRKRPPAVADLQALHSLVRVKDDFTVLESGTQNIVIYTVPEGFVFRQQFISGLSNSGDPSSLAFFLTKGIDNYIYYKEPYGDAYERHICLTPLDYDELEKVTIQFLACQIGNILYWFLFGYLTNKY